ncbi:copper amine oxidase N-terminal domain-containing protein [Cohnella terricola]|uniref:Copper amine oxidase N-terminal domain-containing protein n=1 Tax=Cohnella terricola TaxID=1289167 RepID=A0A559JFP8_9BACL|nr:copper amine oxidase N-terminal domain-containing protein [Cohnella terricola]TVX98703.1 copper amine oxidase N-terminal domain-containing protein [Cohnella terricola]
MKKLSILLLILMAVGLSMLPIEAFSAKAEVRLPTMKSQSIEVLVDARKVKFPDQKPMLENNQVLVPIRFVSDKLGGKLDLAGDEITIVKGDRTVKLVIGAKTASVNGKTITLGLEAKAVNGRTYVPLRFISEALGEKVEWDKLTKFVWIGSKDIPELKDILEPTDIKPYEKYFEGQKFLMDSCYEGCKPATKVYLVSYDDFPFSFNGKSYYRLDLAQNEGRTLVRATTTDKAQMASSFVFLNPKGKVRYAPAGHYEGENNGNFRFHYYLVSNPLDPATKNFTVDQADYILIMADYPGLILVQNPFK